MFVIFVHKVLKCTQKLFICDKIAQRQNQNHCAEQIYMLVANIRYQSVNKEEASEPTDLLASVFVPEWRLYQYQYLYKIPIPIPN